MSNTVKKPSNYNTFAVEKSSRDLSDTSKPQSNNITLLSEQRLFVNMEYLSEIMSCDEDLKREFVELYLRQTTEDPGKLKEALSLQDYEEVKRLAHRMIGGSAACGMTTLVDSLHELECLAESRNLSKVLSLLMKVENEFKCICIFLRKLISPPLT